MMELSSTTTGDQATAPSIDVRRAAVNQTLPTAPWVALALLAVAGPGIAVALVLVRGRDRHGANAAAAQTEAA